MSHHPLPRQHCILPCFCHVYVTMCILTFISKRHGFQCTPLCCAILPTVLTSSNARGAPFSGILPYLGAEKYPLNLNAIMRAKGSVSLLCLGCAGQCAGVGRPEQSLVHCSMPPP